MNKKVEKYLQEFNLEVKGKNEDCDLNQFVFGNTLRIPSDIKELLDNFTEQLFKEFCKEDIEVINSIDVKEFSGFWEAIKKIIINKIKMYKETEYFRTDDDSKKDTIKQIFDRYILIKDSLNPIGDLRAETIENLVQFLDMIVSEQIQTSYSRQLFIDVMYKKYEYSVKILEYIFDLIEFNRPKLTTKYLFDYLDRIENMVREIRVLGFEKNGINN